MTRAEKLLEGFKLGSLGAGHHSVESPEQGIKEEPRVSIKIIKEGFVDKKKMSPFLFWEETDGMKYVLYLDHHMDSTGTKDRATLEFYGGEAIEYRSEVAKRLRVPFLFEDFMAFASNSLLYQAALEHFNSYVKTVKSQGVDGFIKVMPKVTPADRTYREYKDWLKQKREA